MKLRTRIDSNYPFTIIPIRVNRHDRFKKEWLFYWFKFRLTVIWRK